MRDDVHRVAVMPKRPVRAAKINRAKTKVEDRARRHTCSRGLRDKAPQSTRWNNKRKREPGRDTTNTPLPPPPLPPRSPPPPPPRPLLSLPPPPSPPCPPPRAPPLPPRL